MAHSRAIVTQFQQITLFVVFTFTLSITFIARPTSTQVSAQPISPDDQTIIFWHPYNDERQTALETLVENFNTTNSWGIRVETTSFQNSGLLYDQMILQLINNLNTNGNRDGLPNVVIGLPHEIALYALTEDTVVDLNAYWDDSDWGFSADDNSDFLPSIITIGYDPFSQQQLGIPTRLFAEVMVVNMDALHELGYDDPPASHSALIDMACAFRKAGGWSDSKFGAAQGFYLPLESEFLIGMDAANGGSIYDDNPTPAIRLNTSSLQETLATFVELQGRNCIGTVQSSPDAIDAFAAGQSSFYFGSTSTLALLRDNIVQNYATPFEWSIFVLPGQEDPQSLYVFGPVMSLVNHSAESNLAAWLFLKWFVGTEAQTTWIEATGSLPTRQSTFDELSDAANDFPQWQQAQALLNQSTITVLPMLAGYDVVRLEMQFSFQRILANASTIEDELATLENLSNQILTEFAHSEIDD